jgi:lytic murein transglycosylase
VTVRLGMIAVGLVLVAGTAPAALAAECGHDAGGFPSWLARFEARAAAQGISQRAIHSALDHAAYDASVIRLDRSQRSFKLSFEQFYARRVSSSLIRNGQQMLQRHRDLFERIERRFGVPGPVVVALWGLETNFGRDRGQNRSIIGSLATLAYDCRRSEFFHNELISALRIVDRGDMTPSQLRGGWAGEIGPMQFLPSSYVKFAVDFDGDGRRDLIHSVPDMLASTANFLKGHGWRAGQGWGAGSPNYAALREWNKAEVYVRTISVLATKLSGGLSRTGS